MIYRLILRPEDRAANDATNAAGADESRGAKCAFPLTSNVVGLPGEDTRDISIASSGCKEDTEISDANVFDVAKERNAFVR